MSHNPLVHTNYSLPINRGQGSVKEGAAVRPSGLSVRYKRLKQLGVGGWLCGCVRRRMDTIVRMCSTHTRLP